jgi:hypothetical protein
MSGAPSMLPTPASPKPEPEPRYVAVMRHRLRSALEENRRLQRELFLLRQAAAQRAQRRADSR